MTMAYQHFPPGTTRPLKGERLRSWIGDSPYYKNRPLRGPRGGDVLTLLRKPITFKNIPKLERVTVHTMVKAATSNSAPLHVAGMILQAITNVRVEAHAAPKSTASFGIRAGQYLSVTCDLRDENMYHFLSKVVDVVMPKMKDWKGVKGSSGDSSGNLAFGLTSEDVALFPEIEVNYDMYVSPLSSPRSPDRGSLLTCSVQVPAEDDPRLPRHDPYYRHQRPRRSRPAHAGRHPVHRQADRLEALRTLVYYMLPRQTCTAILKPVHSCIVPTPSHHQLTPRVKRGRS